MWGRKEDSVEQPRSELPPRTQGVGEVANTPPARPSVAVPKAARTGSSIGRTVKLKADILGDEDLRIDGELEGKIVLPKSNVTVGPSGKVQADVQAKSIVIEGKIHGNLQASEKIDIRKTGTLEGDIVTVGISIEEGAMFRGSVDIVRRDQVPANVGPVTKKEVVSDKTAPVRSPVSREPKAVADSG